MVARSLSNQIFTEATERARRDLAAGRIRASELAPTIESYAKNLTEKRKDTLAILFPCKSFPFIFPFSEKYNAIS